MNVRINGKDAALPESETLENYLSSRGLNPQAVVIELNDTIVPREQWSGLVLKEGDTLEIVSFVGGG